MSQGTAIWKRSDKNNHAIPAKSRCPKTTSCRSGGSEVPMQKELSTYWYVKHAALFFLVLEGIAVALVVFCLSLPHPLLMLGALGLLVVFYFIWPIRRRKGTSLPSDPGCLIVFLVFLATFFVGIVASLALPERFPTQELRETIWGLFGFLCLLAPAVVFWNLLEQGYYQITAANKLQRELGFKTYTNTLEGHWPTGMKYLYFTHVKPGGLMEQAGFQQNDIVIEPDGFTEFWYKLEHARGKEPVAITVALWDHPEPVSKRPRREVFIRVPPKGDRQSELPS
jgi:hypothetical protein